MAANVAQCQQITFGEEAALCQCGVQAGSGMALGENETVTILPLGIGRIYIQFLGVEIGKHIRSRQTAAGVTCLGCVGSFDDAHANLAGHGHQLLFLVGCHEVLPFVWFLIGNIRFCRDLNVDIIKHPPAKRKGYSTRKGTGIHSPSL